MESELLRIAKKHYENNDGYARLVNDENQNELLNNFKEYPHAFVLGCVMDKQIPAARAWAIPYKISLEFGRFDIDFLANVPEEKYKKIFGHFQTRKSDEFRKIYANLADCRFERRRF